MGMKLPVRADAAKPAVIMRLNLKKSFFKDISSLYIRCYRCGLKLLSVLVKHQRSKGSAIVSQADPPL